jgi:acyl-coenzyme A thioesterase PaaI-like protein
MERYMKEVIKYSQCFVCGEENESGLKVKFFYENGKVKAEYIASNKFQGYKDILHGGIISALLDEVMIKTVLAKGVLAVTCEMSIEFKQPRHRRGEKLLLEGEIVSARGGSAYGREDREKIFWTKGKVTKTDNTLVALGTGKYVKINEKLRKLLENSLE